MVRLQFRWWRCLGEWEVDRVLIFTPISLMPLVKRADICVCAIIWSSSQMATTIYLDCIHAKMRFELGIRFNVAESDDTWIVTQSTSRIKKIVWGIAKWVAVLWWIWCQGSKRMAWLFGDDRNQCVHNFWMLYVNLKGSVWTVGSLIMHSKCSCWWYNFYDQLNPCD